ncbi:DNA polymerase epsilon subunit 4-like [Palaemon carinicauda]|uniref:DNA polymerase epsilon subunit 4-like n=1 Tax=Palaemon carinicauda TaxID=392227 RepID=UPI0035B63379
MEMESESTKLSSVESPMETSSDIAGDGEERGCQLPLARIKRIMKADPDLQLCNQDAVFLVAKATELFIDSLVQEVCQYTVQSRKKTVSKRDLDNCINAIDTLAFLDGAME